MGEVSYIKADTELFREHFNRHPFRFKHDLASDPRLRLGALYELATSIPPGEVLHWSGKISVDSNIDTASKTHATNLSLRETFDRIETAGSYILIRNAQLNPVFGQLTNDILDEVTTLTEAIDPGMHKRVAYIFIASPGSTTPYHMDRDINFHFNVRGTKWISIWDPLDRLVLPETGLESLFRNYKAPRPPYKPEYESRAEVFKLEPGEGVHHPFTAPHSVRYGDDVAISFTVTFNTRSTSRRAAAHFLNSAIRRVGVTPAPVGQSVARDELKFAMLQGYRRVKAMVTGARTSG